MRQRLRIALAAAGVLALTGSLAGVLTVTMESSAATAMMYGIYESDSLSWSAIAATGQHPNVVNYYSGWQEPFDTQFATTAYQNGAEIFVEMEPWNDGNVTSSACSGTSGVPALTAIASGQYDSYLQSFAAAVKAFGHPVLITFAHEMNGSWYPWGANGCEHDSAAQWVAAWDHVRNVVKAGASNANFMWIPNVEPGVGSFAPYWPGSSNVDSVGIDGYPQGSNQTFAQVFGSSFSDLRVLTSLPIYIAETDLAKVPNIPQFVTDMKNAGGNGLLIFQVDGVPLMSSSQWQALGQALSATPRGASAVPGNPTTAPATTSPAPTPSATISRSGSQAAPGVPTASPSVPGTPGSSSSSAAAGCSTSAALGSCGPYDNYAPITGITAGTSISIGNDMWNPVSGSAQTLHASSPGDWGVTASMPAGNVTVVSFPSVSADYMQASSASTPLSDYASIYSSFTENMNAASGTSAWAAYNINVGQGSGTTATADVMIDNDFAGAGGCTAKATATFGGSGGVPAQQWSLCQFGTELVWRLAGDEQSGSVDILAMLRWLVTHGYLPTDTGLFDINYGWQIASTGGHTENFQVTRFSITTTKS